MAELDRMVGLAMGMLERLGRQDAADEAAQLRPDREIYQNFTMISRVARLAMTLRNRLGEETEKRKERGAVGTTLDRLEQEGKRKAKVRQVVEAAITAYPTKGDKEPLYEKLYERLDAPDWIIGDRPLGEIVESFCRDLGLELDESLWAEVETVVQDAPAEPAAPTLLSDAAPELTRTVVERALSGNVAALRLCLEHLAPPPARERTIVLQHRKPGNAYETADVMADLVAAMTSGKVTPAQAASAAGVIDTYRRVLELTEIDARLSAPEAREADP